MHLQTLNFFFCKIFPLPLGNDDVYDVDSLRLLLPVLSGDNN